MSEKTARANVAQLRQTTQFTCCATSITSALHALGKKYTEDDVNKVLGAAPMSGATWEAMLATVQYFGCRGTLVVPSTPRMLKEWTDQGIPVVIAWNPEGRPWSHASTVFDVTEDENGKLTVYVMDSNIPNPDETTRVMDADTFCQKWGEKVSDTLIVRRPAMAVTLEVSPAGRQMIASSSSGLEAKFEAMRLSGPHLRGLESLAHGGEAPTSRVGASLAGQGLAVQKNEVYQITDMGRKFLSWLDEDPSSTLSKSGARENDYHEPTDGFPMNISQDMIRRVADAHEAKSIVVKNKNPKGPGRTEYGPEFVTEIMRHPGNGVHHTRTKDVERGTGRPKHKKPWGED